LLLLPLGLSVLAAPPRLICDSRVLERYILEAKEAENVTVRPPGWYMPYNLFLGLQGSSSKCGNLILSGTWVRGKVGSQISVRMIKLVTPKTYLGKSQIVLERRVWGPEPVRILTWAMCYRWAL
jgi:hypothetical protein